MIAFILSLIACALLYYGFSAISQLPGLEAGIDYYVEMAGIDFHYRSISRGVIDSRNIIYFLSVILLFLNYYLPEPSKTMKNVFGKMLTSKYGWLLLLVLLIIVNYLASIAHYRIDLTREKRYTLSKATKDLLRSVDDKVEIEVFLKGEFPAGFRKLANSTEEFLQLLKDRNSSNIQYAFISPAR